MTTWSSAHPRKKKIAQSMNLIRAIVVNMIVHRDYAGPSESSIKIFKNRIEFFNPGMLAEGLPISTLNPALSGKR